ncbi:uncharacterized protein AMSG_03010 [Thecamonas trahens ATCC 50062]|uniref:Tyrosine-protein kinase ephrin type A/B receptor-like domain-containing protein n=1 Tax=Thecamonas trahens ATCC 50062 TaxID=461836 RepID=A0A0L0D346_THETB|nr:hypothetical protein AMSG_03010 [Thecamonas trahens ATCC 50062]KNC46575.1 hypothetical protein AMSG_03010 [Thecamonas trahens ATCC 50062]|eukprot:XP_013760352.1 hypothetical protein AMSG_03010 [Thecamonas trahens ATCC 50062]
MSPHVYAALIILPLLAQLVIGDCPAPPWPASILGATSPMVPNVEQHGNKVASMDVNGDGFEDLLYPTASRSTYANILTLLLSDGSGGYTASNLYSPSPPAPITSFNGVAFAHVDYDGVIDIVVHSYADFAFMWYKGVGDGSFTDQGGSPTPNTGTLLYSTSPSRNHFNNFVFADIDADGQDDLVYHDFEMDKAVVLLKDPAPGPLGWTAHVVCTGKEAYFVKAADINGDTYPDVTCTFHGSVDIVVRYSNAAPLTTASTVAVLNHTEPVRTHFLHDVDADGDIDLIVAGQRTETILFYINADGSALPLTASFAVYSSSRITDQIILLDVDNNGLDDFVLGSYSNLPSIVPKLSTLADPSSYGAPSKGPSSGGRGVAPLARGPYGYPAIATIGDRVPNANLYPILPVPRDWSLSSLVAANHLDVVTGDVNADAHLDLIATSASSVSVYLNSGIGTFSPSSSLTVELSFAPAAVRLADLDGDAALDLILQDGASALVWCRNTGGSALASFVEPLTLLAPPPSVGPALVTVIPTSLNADDDVDLLIVGSTGIAIVLNNGAGSSASFAPPLDLATGLATVTAAAIADLTSDARQDIVYAVAAGTISMIAADTAPGTFVAPVVLTTASSTPVGHLHLADVDGSTALDLVWSSPSAPGFAFAVNNGVGGFGGGPVVVAGLDSANTEALAVVRDMEFNGRAHVAYGAVSSGSVAWAMSTRTATRFPLHAHLNLTTESSRFQLVGLSALAADDIDGNGAVDLVVATPSGVHLLHAGSLVVGNTQRATSAVRYDHPECGGVSSSMACVGAALARIRSCTPRINLPPRIVRCSRTGPALALHHNTVLGGEGGRQVVVDCSLLGGTFLRIPAGSSITLDHISVVGASSSTSPLGSAPLLVDSASLTLTHCTFSRCSSAAATVFQVNAGIGGAVSVVGGNAQLTVTNTTFTANTAGTAGGAIGVTGSDHTITLVDSRFESNTALAASLSVGGGGAIGLVGASTPTLFWTGGSVSSCVASSGHGGALFVSASSLTAAITHVAFVGNSAPLGAGGTVALEGGNTVVLDVAGNRTVVDASFAGFGGALAVAASGYLPTSVVSTALRRAPGGLIGPIVTVRAGASLGSSSAVYGGATFACAGLIDLSAANYTGASLATVAGGEVFVCNGHSPSWLALPALHSHTSSVGAAGYGSGWASPPAVLSVTATPPQVISGIVLGAGHVTAVDEMGTTVVDSRIALVPQSSNPDIVIEGLVFGIPFDTYSGTFPLNELSARGRGAALDTPVGIDIGARDSVDAVVTTSFTVTFTACPAGFGRSSSEDAPLLCAPCATGLYSNSTSSQPCMPEPNCGDGLFHNGACVYCPANTLRFLTNTSAIGECMCRAGYYAPARVSNTPCLACPAGAVCDGQLASPLALPGWGRMSEYGFAECPIDGACLGERVTPSCAPEYASDSLLCKSCAVDHYRLTDSQCDKCPNSAVSLFSLFVALIVVVAAASFLVVVVTAKHYAQADSLSTEANGVGREQRRISQAVRTRLVPHSLSVATVYLQILGILATLPFNWPEPPVIQLLQTANVANIDLSLFATDCTVRAFPMRYALSIIVPLVFFALTGIFIAVVKLAPATLPCIAQLGHVSGWAVAGRLLFTFGPLLYIPLCRATLIFFDCTKLPDGKYYLDANLDEACYDATWFILLPLAAGAVIVYVVAMPAFFTYVLWYNRATLASPRTLMRYGPIYMSYRTSYFWYEVALLIKRLAIVATALFFSKLEVWLFSLLCAIFLISGAFQLRHEPFFFPLHNQLETRLDAAVIILLGCGMLFWADKFPNSGTYAVAAAIAATVIVVSVLILIFAILRELQFAVWKRRRARRATAPSELAPSAPLSHDELSTRDAIFVSIVDRHIDDLEHPALYTPLIAMRTSLDGSSAKLGDSLNSQDAVEMTIAEAIGRSSDESEAASEPSDSLVSTVKQAVSTSSSDESSPLSSAALSSRSTRSRSIVTSYGRRPASKARQPLASPASRTGTASSRASRARSSASRAPQT